MLAQLLLLFPVDKEIVYYVSEFEDEDEDRCDGEGKAYVEQCFKGLVEVGCIIHR